MKDLFDRRIGRGQCYRTPYLGWSEFTCSYWGPFREGVTEVDRNFAMDIPSMLLCMWNSPSQGKYEPKFHQNVKIIDGVMKYRVPQEWLYLQNQEVKTYAQ